MLWQQHVLFINEKGRQLGSPQTREEQKSRTTDHGRTLPESSFPCLSLSDLQLPAVPVAAHFALVGEVVHDNEDADEDDHDDGGGGCFVARSVNTEC